MKPNLDESHSSHDKLCNLHATRKISRSSSKSSEGNEVQNKGNLLIKIPKALSIVILGHRFLHCYFFFIGGEREREREQKILFQVLIILATSGFSSDIAPLISVLLNGVKCRPSCDLEREREREKKREREKERERVRESEREREGERESDREGEGVLITLLITTNI